MVDLKYINGVLNSKLIAYFFQKKFGDIRVGGGYLQFKKQFTTQIPVLLGNNSHEKEISELVNQILSTKKSGENAKTGSVFCECGPAQNTNGLGKHPLFFFGERILVPQAY